MFLLVIFLLPFELLKNREQIEGLVSWLVELPGKFTSDAAASVLQDGAANEGNEWNPGWDHPAIPP